MKSKNIGIGILVRKDINGKDIMVGDTVRVTRPEMHFDGHGGTHVIVCSKTWEGELKLLLSKGVVIKTGDIYVKPPITDNSRYKWNWELLEKGTAIKKLLTNHNDNNLHNKKGF